MLDASAAPALSSRDPRARLRAVGRGCSAHDDPRQVQAAGRLGGEDRGDDALSRTANGVSVVRIAPGESAGARIAAYERRADVVYAEPNGRVYALALNAPTPPAQRPDRCCDDGL